MSRPKRTILLVEDETSIREPLAEVLRSEGFETLVAGTVAEALEQARREPDLVLLDVMLPDGSGYDVCRELRRDSQVPIIMLTARGEEADRVVGLELGADDYVVKPFSGREVVARIRAVLRRTAAPEPRRRPAARGRDVRLDPARHEVTLRGEALELSRKEFELLRLLMRNAGSVVTRERLIDEVWDPNWFGSTKTLDVHVSGIRRKLGDDPASRATCTRCAASASASRRPTRSNEPPPAAAGRVRLRAAADHRRARGAARAQPGSADRRRGEERGGRAGVRRGGERLGADAAARSSSRRSPARPGATSAAA